MCRRPDYACTHACANLSGGSVSAAREINRARSINCVPLPSHFSPEEISARSRRNAQFPQNRFLEIDSLVVSSQRGARVRTTIPMAIKNESQMIPSSLPTPRTPMLFCRDPQPQDPPNGTVKKNIFGGELYRSLCPPFRPPRLSRIARLGAVSVRARAER